MSGHVMVHDDTDRSGRQVRLWMEAITVGAGPQDVKTLDGPERGDRRYSVGTGLTMSDRDRFRSNLEIVTAS
jgi:hypothetical protein